MKPLSSALGMVLAVATATVASAQVSSINSVTLSPRMYNDIPGASLNVGTIYQPYPNASLISFTEQGVSAPNGYANRDAWRFSNNGGTSAYAFANNDFFNVTMTLTLMGSPTSPRKEAGFLLNTIGGDGQFIVNTDAHEIVAFGGPLPFFAFPSTFISGNTITLGMNYFLDSNTGLRSIVYSANGVNSPILALSNLEQGIIDGSTLGGYFQIVNSPTDHSNSGIAVFQDLSISSVSVPEPSVMALALLGAAAISYRARFTRG
ncbi:MAG: hypothetical protein V9H26_16980 [Verrucomicrobiota bacterium]